VQYRYNKFLGARGKDLELYNQVNRNVLNTGVKNIRKARMMILTCTTKQPEKYCIFKISGISG